MNWKNEGHRDIEQAHFLLAMHSSSETLGVAVLDLRNPETSRKSATFPIGRKLSNNLLTCVQELLPTLAWHKICRLAVATGPGGFTGTRLTVAMARTLAQQIGCPLDGVSSFALMSPRLSQALKPQELIKPFWIIKHLKRRGTVGGRYLIQKESKFNAFNQVLELDAPHLLASNFEATPALEAQEDVVSDVNRLLEVSKAAHKEGERSLWSKVLPIYPTSPVSPS